MKPTLVILAAGMGSRYGGLKQIDTVGNNGEAIIDFTIYDAIQAGFKKLILIIRKEHEQAFEEHLVARIRPFIEVEYAFQDLNDLPCGVEVPSERAKPWGTTHALLACRHLLKDDPFVICNADDFYGKDAFNKIAAYLKDAVKEKHYCMVGYKLANTLSDNGSVTRGFCQTDSDGNLSDIKEVMKIKKVNDQAVVEEDGKDEVVSNDTVVSMNFWGFFPDIMPMMMEEFEKQLPDGIKANPLKYEALLPNYVGDLIHKGKCDVHVLTSNDSWFGVTYQDDKPKVVAKIQEYKDQGLYPFDLWEVK